MKRYKYLDLNKIAEKNIPITITIWNITDFGFFQDQETPRMMLKVTTIRGNNICY